MMVVTGLVDQYAYAITHELGGGLGLAIGSAVLCGALGLLFLSLLCFRSFRSGVAIGILVLWVIMLVPMAYLTI